MIVTLPKSGGATPTRRFEPIRIRPVRAPLGPVERDTAIRRAVEKALGSSRYFSLRRVRCFVRDGVIVLFGTVTTYYMKQVAQTVVMNLGFALPVDNRCQVQYRTSDNES